MNESLVLRQQFEISQSRLFSLLSTPKYLEQWFSPSAQIAIKVLLHDFHEGGHFQLQYSLLDGHQLVANGMFKYIEAPNIISFTWEWQPPDIHAGIPTLVTWRLTDKHLSTELTVTQEHIPNKEFYERHKEGWLGAFKRLLHMRTK